MSLHAELSPEAQAKLRRQQRISTVSSIAISLLVIVLIALVLAFVLLPAMVRENPTIVAYQPVDTKEEKIQEKQMSQMVEQKPAAPPSAMSRVITSQSLSNTAVPVPDILMPEPSADFGSSAQFDDGWGDSNLGDGGLGGIPSTMKKRCSPADRIQRLRESGGTEECEAAVEKALEWLQNTQNSDGSWSNPKGAMTGFALLAYLGRCETPLSPKYGETVLNGITFLIDLGLKNDGRLASTPAGSNQWVYEHAIATYALAEAYTFCNQLGLNIPKLDEVTLTAGNMIIDGQGESGGWVYRYAPTNGGDNSVGFWQIQAMKACKHTGLWEKNAFRRPSSKALEWLSKVQGSNGAIGYRNSPGRSPGLTGGGVLAFQMWDKSKSSEVRKGIDYVSKNSEFDWDNDNSNLYYHYYNAQAMIHHGGSEWAAYNQRFRDELLKNQQSDGSWKRNRKISHGSINTHMTTCLAVLMLEVYYRFLPATGEGI